MNSESHWSAKRPIPFTNVSGQTIPAFAVMAITGVGYENGVAFLRCQKPDTGFRRAYAINNIFDVPPGRRGTCFRSGDVRVLYGDGTPEAGEGWGPKPGQWSLAKGFPSTTAVAGIVDPVHKILLGSLHEIKLALVKTTDAIPNETTSSDYKIYAGALGSEVDAGFTTIPDARNRTGATIPNDTWAHIVWINGGWEFIKGGGKVVRKWKNYSGGVVYRYWYLQVIGVEQIEGEAHLKCIRPQTTFPVAPLFVVNDDNIVADGSTGDLQPGPDLLVDTYNAPTFGRPYGPYPGQFGGALDYPGFVCLGGPITVESAPYYVVKDIGFNNLVGKVKASGSAIAPHTRSSNYDLMIGDPGDDDPSDLTVSAWTMPGVRNETDVELGLGEFFGLTLRGVDLYGEPWEC